MTWNMHGARHGQLLPDQIALINQWRPDVFCGTELTAWSKKKDRLELFKRELGFEGELVPAPLVDCDTGTFWSRASEVELVAPADRRYSGVFWHSFAPCRLRWRGIEFLAGAFHLNPFSVHKRAEEAEIIAGWLGFEPFSVLAGDGNFRPRGGRVDRDVPGTRLIRNEGLLGGDPRDIGVGDDQSRSGDDVSKIFEIAGFLDAGHHRENYEPTAGFGSATENPRRCDLIYLGGGNEIDIDGNLIRAGGFTPGLKSYEVLAGSRGLSDHLAIGVVISYSQLMEHRKRAATAGVLAAQKQR